MCEVHARSSTTIIVYNTPHKSILCFRNKLIAARGTKERAGYCATEWRLSIALYITWAIHVGWLDWKGY